MFSEESKLLIQHWDAVEDIFEAEERLSVELKRFLFSMKDVCSRQDWWASDWSFCEYEDEQVYISHKSWIVEKDPVIWIGVQDFDTDQLFGTKPSPVMYVWVPGKLASTLGKALQELLEDDETQLVGKLDTKASGYVVKKPLPKCLPEDVADFEESVTNALVEFFGHYAALEPQFTEVVRRVMSNSEG